MRYSWQREEKTELLRIRIEPSVKADLEQTVPEYSNISRVVRGLIAKHIQDHKTAGREAREAEAEKAAGAE